MSRGTVISIVRNIKDKNRQIIISPFLFVYTNFEVLWGKKQFIIQ